MTSTPRIPGSHGMGTPHRPFLLTGQLSTTADGWLVLLQLDGKWLPVGMGPDPPGSLARVRLCHRKLRHLFQEAQEESATELLSGPPKCSKRVDGKGPLLNSRLLALWGFSWILGI